MTVLKTTAAGIYVELDPGDVILTTGLIVYVEIGAGEGAAAASIQTTALQALAEIQPGVGVKVTALIALVEIWKPWGQVYPARILPPESEIFDEEGKRLDYVQRARIQRAFLLNDAGSGELAVASKNSVVVQRFLHVDHLVLVRSRFGLPDWCGVITEIEYTGDGIVTAHLQEGLALLSRWNGFGLPLGELAAGGLDEITETGTLQALIIGSIARINARFESLVRIRELQLNHVDVLDFQHAATKSVLDELRELSEAYLFDFWTEPFFDASGRLRIGLHILDIRIRDRRTQVSLWEGKHLGGGCRYKQFSTFYGAPYAEALELEVIDPTVWGYMELGDVFSVHAPSLGPAGIESDFRALGFEPNEDGGVLTIVGYLL